MTLPLAFYIDTEDQTPGLRACAPSTVDRSIFPAVFLPISSPLLCLDSDGKMCWKRSGSWAVIDRVTTSRDTKHLVWIYKLTWQKNMLFACLLVPKCPVSEQKEEKGELYNCGWHRREGRSGAHLAVACFVYFQAQQKTTWDSCRAFSPPPLNQLRKGKQNLQVLLRILMSNANIIQQHKWEMTGFCRGCVAIAEGNARLCAHVNEERIKDPVWMGKGGFKGKGCLILTADDKNHWYRTQSASQILDSKIKSLRNHGLAQTLRGQQGLGPITRWQLPMLDSGL